MKERETEQGGKRKEIETNNKIRIGKIIKEGVTRIR